jgi:thioredoxin reductase (NADPH)
VVGGGNSAAADALLLSKICAKVYLIHCRDTMRAEKVHHEPLMKAEGIEFLWNSEVSELIYDKRLSGVKIRNKQSGEESELSLDGLFISIGRSPVTAAFGGQVALDGSGYIIAGEDTKTSIEGVFAAGDVRTKALRQIVTAAADGAVAAHFAEEYIATL